MDYLLWESSFKFFRWLYEYWNFEVNHPDKIQNVVKTCLEINQQKNVWSENLDCTSAFYEELMKETSSWNGPNDGFHEAESSMGHGWGSLVFGQWSQSTELVRAYSKSSSWPQKRVHEGFRLRWYLRLFKTSSKTPTMPVWCRPKNNISKTCLTFEENKMNVELGIIGSFVLFLCFIDWHFLSNSLAVLGRVWHIPRVSKKQFFLFVEATLREPQAYSKNLYKKSIQGNLPNFEKR